MTDVNQPDLTMSFLDNAVRSAGCGDAQCKFVREDDALYEKGCTCLEIRSVQRWLMKAMRTIRPLPVKE